MSSLSLGERVGEHLHLGELVDAIQPARGPARGPGLRAEAVADAAKLQGQVFGIDGLAGEEPAERDLGRRHQAQVALLDAVDLRLRPAGNEADALQDLVAGQVGRGHGREALLEQHIQGITLQGQIQQHGVVLEEVEAVPCHAGPALEVDQVELLRQFDVIERLEIELRDGRLAARDFEVRLVVDSHRCSRVGEVGNHPHDRVRLSRDLVEPLLDGGGLVADAAALFLQSVSLVGRRLADGARSLVGLAIGLVQLRLQRLRSVSSATKRSTSAVALRFLQLSLTSSALSTMNLGSSMGARGKVVSSKTRIISAFTSGCQSQCGTGSGNRRAVINSGARRSIKPSVNDRIDFQKTAACIADIASGAQRPHLLPHKDHTMVGRLASSLVPPYFKFPNSSHSRRWP